MTVAAWVIRGLPVERHLRLRPFEWLHHGAGQHVCQPQQRPAGHLSAPNAQSVLRFNETAHGDFWFEADVELLTDPSARKHLGLWMTTGNGSEGYRFAHLDGGWSVSRWNSGFGDGAGVIGGVNDGARPIAGLADLAPTFNVGQQMTLRCELIVGAFDVNGVPWARLIQFKAGGLGLTFR